MERGGRQRIPRPPDARPGAAPAWAHLHHEERRFSLAEVRARLGALPPARPARRVATDVRAAAVLLPLFEEDDEVRVILTKRPETMPSHRGEIAFPGGTYDPDVDVSMRDTALRETEEEIGLPPGDVEVVAELDGLATVGSRFTITPFVGLVATRPRLVPDPTEVVDVFDVALSELMHDDTFREERWETRGPGFTVQFYEIPGETVWGATARILTGFLAHLVAGRAPTPVGGGGS